MKKIFRLVSTLVAIALGVYLINTLTHLGHQSKGPLEDILVKLGSYVTEGEKYLMDKKGERIKSLEWFSEYKTIDQLKAPSNILLGAFDNKSKNDFNSIIELEASLNTTFPILHIYTAWGDKLDQRFPLTQVKAIHDLGSVPMISWEPWLVDFDSEIHPEIRDIEERDKGGLKDIANGDYDFYLEKWVEDLKQIKEPIFIRWGHEMNDPYRYTWGPPNNEPQDFTEAWRYLVNYFRESGVNNVLWVWSPHIAYGLFEEYYPGDEFVDWIGVGSLNYGTVAPWSKWWTFHEIFGNHYYELNEFKKPIMISEFGCLEVGGERREWYEEAFCELPECYPNLKSILFFHFNSDNTLTYKTLDWSIIGDSLVCSSIKQCINTWPDSLFVH